VGVTRRRAQRLDRAAPPRAEISIEIERLMLDGSLDVNPEDLADTVQVELAGLRSSPIPVRRGDRTVPFATAGTDLRLPGSHASREIGSRVAGIVHDAISGAASDALTISDSDPRPSRIHG